MPIYLKEGRRWPGSEWLKNHPAFLESSYATTKRWVKVLYPLLKRISPSATEQLMIWAEKTSKGYLFNCQMCGQCILHSTGMTCPMNCPKNLRNGPCGGVRANGHCEVIPERMCVWVQAWERSRVMPTYGNDILVVQPPVNHQLENTSAWINLFEGIDQQHPVGWIPLSELK
jgi:hypothetical protein